MKQATLKTSEEKPWVQGLAARLKEGALILCLAVSGYFLIALLTYHHSDPGWSHSARKMTVLNAGGRAGAWFADVFLYAFGYAAYVFPVMCALIAWLTFREHPSQNDKSAPMVTLRVIGFVLILLSATALVNIHLSVHAHLPFQSGGIVGLLIGNVVLKSFNVIGASIILLSLLLCGVTLATGLSWLAVVDGLGRLTCQLAQRTKEAIQHRSQQFKTKMSTFINERRQARAAKPKIVTPPKLTTIDAPPASAPKIIPPKAAVSTVTETMTHATRVTKRRKRQGPVLGILPPRE